MHKYNYLIFCAVAGAGLLIDQGTKLYIDRSLVLYESIPVIDNFFSITYVRNPGAAFGLFAESGFRLPFLIGVTLVALVAIIIAVHILRDKANTAVIPLSCIFAGASGNLIDRVRLGEVIDFIDVYWKNYHWPAFNIADSAICLGVFLYLAFNMREERRLSLETRGAHKAGSASLQQYPGEKQ
jgi:signal peptidase II